MLKDLTRKELVIMAEEQKRIISNARIILNEIEQAIIWRAEKGMI